jgi:hypothetical protein
MGVCHSRESGNLEDAKEASDSASFGEMFSAGKFAMLRDAGTSEAGHLR